MPGRAEAGFSLIEVLVAVAVLAIGLTAGFKLQILDLDLIRTGRSSTRATLAAESLLWRMTVSPPAPGQVEEGEIDGFAYRAVTRSDQARPGLNRVDLVLQRIGSGAPAESFQRLLAAAEPGREGGGQGSQEKEGEEEKQGQEGKSGPSGGKDQ